MNKHKFEKKEAFIHLDFDSGKWHVYIPNILTPIFEGDSKEEALEWVANHGD